MRPEGACTEAAPSGCLHGSTVPRAGKLILLVEDDPTLSDVLAYSLRRAGYEVIQADNGRTGLETALSRDVDLVLMDVLLPALDGITASREILRRKPDLPLIILSVVEEREKLLEGFRIGADDYVTKPFDPDLLLARIRASLRRADGNADGSWPGGGRRGTTIGDLCIDDDVHSIRTEFAEAFLTPKEQSLLELFRSQPGHLFTKQEITESVWHHRYISSSRTLEVHVRRLRNKLRSIRSDVQIQTIRAIGYRLSLAKQSGEGDPRES